MHQMKKLLW